MENASKALIIAGAILVSILLISIGVMVIQSTGNVQQGMAETMDSSAAQQFNGKFDPYLGAKKSASTARALCSAIIANNATSSHQISVNGKTSSTDISTVSSGFENNTSYTITVTTIDTNGYYSAITIN